MAEAFVKLILFLGYMLLISRMKDIQRTFMYHGAEHKCINCVEHGMPLTVENVMASSRQTMWDQLSVSCHAGEYLSAFCFCSGAGLLGAAFRQTSDGAGRCRDFL